MAYYSIVACVPILFLAHAFYSYLHIFITVTIKRLESSNNIDSRSNITTFFN